MYASESVNYSNISATTSAFQLRGGLYGVDAIATFGGGSVDLQILARDGSSYTAVSSGTTFTAAGYQTVYLKPGQYRVAVTTATAVYVDITRIPH